MPGLRQSACPFARGTTGTCRRGKARDSRRAVRQRSCPGSVYSGPVCPAPPRRIGRRRDRTAPASTGCPAAASVPGIRSQQARLSSGCRANKCPDPARIRETARKPAKQKGATRAYHVTPCYSGSPGRARTADLVINSPVKTITYETLQQITSIKTESCIRSVIADACG